MEPKYEKLDKRAGRAYADDRPLLYGYVNLEPTVMKALTSQSPGSPLRITRKEFEAAVESENADPPAERSE